MDSKAVRQDSGHLWIRTLPQSGEFAPVPHDFRLIGGNDAPSLGRLFFTAFKDTVDDTGQTETDYVAKALAILDGRYGDCISAASWVFEHYDKISSACIVTDYKPYGCPVIAIVATAPSEQGTGRAGNLVRASLASLMSLGYRQCCAKISDGNVASNHLFARCGFVPT